MKVLHTRMGDLKGDYLSTRNAHDVVLSEGKLILQKVNEGLKVFWE